jgi:hypothetical protein
MCEGKQKSQSHRSYDNGDDPEGYVVGGLKHCAKLAQNAATG